MELSLLELGRLLVGCLIITFGLLALAISLLGHRRTDPLLASFGAFTLLWGVRLAVGTPALAAGLGLSQFTVGWIISNITYLINVPAWIFFWLLIGRGWRSMLFWWVRVMAVFAVVAVASDLLQGQPQTLGAVNSLLVMAGIILAGASLRHARAALGRDLGLLTAGLAVFGLLAINDNLVGMGAVPWPWKIETFGFVFYLGCLGLIAARRFFAKEAQLAGLESELKTARDIQLSILPSRLPAVEGLDVAVRFRPTSEVAGDLYDFLEVDDDGLGVLIADVSGHGVPAALIASMVKVAVASKGDEARRPAHLLSEVNRVLCGSFQRGFVTASYAWVDPTSGTVTVANGGHPDPLLRRAGAGAVEEVGGHGAILGRFATAGFEEQTLSLDSGDRLLFYTDGVTEARNQEGEMFGEERLRAFLARTQTAGPEELCDALLDRLSRWTGTGAHLSTEDDITLVVVDRRQA